MKKNLFLTCGIVIVAMTMLICGNVQAEISDKAIKSAKEQASEYLIIEIINHNTKPATPEDRNNIWFTAKVLEIKRSKADLKIGDIIIIESYHFEPDESWVGPAIPPILPAGWRGEAFLNQSKQNEKNFEIAIYGHSFVPLQSSDK